MESMARDDDLLIVFAAPDAGLVAGLFRELVSILQSLNILYF